MASTSCERVALAVTVAECQHGKQCKIHCGALFSPRLNKQHCSRDQSAPFTGKRPYSSAPFYEEDRRYCAFYNMFGRMETYHPPEWATTLSYIPKKRIHLAMPNTPIHPWKVPGVPADFSVSVKRDDLTGCALSGNKVRKLEFLMAEALDQDCSHVITCGTVQSNHCRAVALCARQLGLTPHLLLRTDITDVKQVSCEGNMLLNRLCGAFMYLVPPTDRFRSRLQDKMQRLARHIQSSTGESSYVIPVGGSNKTGLFGAITVFEELIQQGVLEQFDDMVFPCGGRGGTAAGLAIANHLTGGHLRLHAILVTKIGPDFYTHLEEILRQVGLGHLKLQDLVRIVHGYDGQGFDLSSDEELEFIQQVVAETSIVLDPVYSGKTALGMVKEMQNNPSAFKGRRVLFIHTGGIFGLFDGRMTPLLEGKEEQQSCIKMWTELDGLPL